MTTPTTKKTLTTNSTAQSRMCTAACRVRRRRSDHERGERESPWV